MRKVIKRRRSIYIIYETDRELLLYKHLLQVYHPKTSEVSITADGGNGLSPILIIAKALSNPTKEKYVWLDDCSVIKDEDDILKELKTSWELINDIPNNISALELARLNTNEHWPQIITLTPSRFNQEPDNVDFYEERALKAELEAKTNSVPELCKLLSIFKT